MLATEPSRFQITSSAECNRASATEHLPLPLRSLYREPRAFAVDRFAADEAAIDKIECKCLEKGDFGHRHTSGLTARRRLGLDCRNQFGRKMRGQALNDIKQLDDFPLPQRVDLVVQQFDFQFRLHIDPLIMQCTPAVDFRLSILAHQDDRRCICSLKRQNQVQQDKGIGIPTLMNATAFSATQMASTTL
jgi:hypothetical protein